MFALTVLGYVILCAVICAVVPRVAPKGFAEQREIYQHNHKTLGCRIAHMFGIPMIALSIPVLIFAWQWALGLFVVGWILQFLGHFVFEGNRPVLGSKGGSRFTIVYAVIFVAEEWRNLLTGRSTKE